MNKEEIYTSTCSLFCQLDSPVTELRTVDSMGLFVVCQDKTRWIIDNNGKKKEIFKVVRND